ncbi:MAG: hypothetical protein LBB42_00970, partial [Coriobacteriales bacterium]|nr:hypothetical protein [Coriobacteriales bacterium]
MNKSVAVKSIEFSCFRNYSKLELGELARLVIIVGDNALGKTNIIEGIQLLSTMDSFRKPAWRDVVQKGEEQAHISLVYEANGCENNTSLEIKDNKRFYQYNEKPKKTRDLLGLLPAVLFTPSDLQIIQGPAEFRRLCIDNLGCQLSRTFVEIKQEYTRVVKQKNALLRDGYTDQHILASWNRNLAKLGSSLLEHRRSLFEKMLKKAAEVYHQIAPKESFSAEYVPSWQLLDEKNERPESYSSNEGALPEVELGAEDKAPQPVFFEENGEECAGQTLQDNRQTNNQNSNQTSNQTNSQTSEEHFVSLLEKHHFAEARSRRALIGPHRDEIRFFIDGNDARRFGSQGQQRSLALALKIAEVEILRELTGTDPLLLLDDVMS